MKRIFLALFLLSWTLGAASQNVALGEKTPDLKVKSWLDDRMPVPGRTFCSSFSTPRAGRLSNRSRICRSWGGSSAIGSTSWSSSGRVRRPSAGRPPYAEGNLTVAFDDQRPQFRPAYDVQYLPFGVLVSAKGRALWMGNPRQLTEAILDSNL